ncbi:hypothetical protein SEEN185_06382 [Salmonella enterica subsp. enterica serovar Newport str. CVM 35185]|nr:hypothetical protein SEEN185_06382 [Salmonella enterica subsp. enterica serovar Newport str. CVM 35185]
MFPAPAGINPLLKKLNEGNYRVPRASGDKPIVLSPLVAWVKCSPRQRG